MLVQICVLECERNFHCSLIQVLVTIFCHLVYCHVNNSPGSPASRASCSYELLMSLPVIVCSWPWFRTCKDLSIPIVVYRDLKPSPIIEVGPNTIALFKFHWTPNARKPHLRSGAVIREHCFSDSVQAWRGRSIAAYALDWMASHAMCVGNRCRLSPFVNLITLARRALVCSFPSFIGA